MPSPKSPDAPTIVKPTEPTAAQEADVADPGQVEEVKQGQRETKTGKYGSQKAKPHKENSEENKDKTHWIEVELIDDSDAPVAGEIVEIECPDGSVASRATDAKGIVRVSHIEAGSCKIKFPKLDAEAWEPA